MKQFFASRGTRYLVVGLVNTIFGFSVFTGLELSAGRVLPYLVVLVLAHIVAVLEAFLLQRCLVFRSQGPWLPELIRFWSVSLFVLALNVVLLLLAVEIAHAPLLLSQLCIFLLLVITSYVLHRSFSFSTRPRPLPPVTSARPPPVTSAKGSGRDPEARPVSE